MGASTSIQAEADRTLAANCAYTRLFDLLDKNGTGYLGAQDFILAFRPYNEASPQGKAIKKVLNCALDIESSSDNKKISKEAWRGVACTVASDSNKYNISNDDRDILAIEINRVCKRRETINEQRKECMTGDQLIDEITTNTAHLRELREAGMEHHMDDTGVVPFTAVPAMLKMITTELGRGSLCVEDISTILAERKLESTDVVDQSAIGPLVLCLLRFLGKQHVKVTAQAAPKPTT